MPDGYGRLIANETPAASRLGKLLYPDKRICWVCGAELTEDDGPTVCRLGIHRGKRPIFDMSIAVNKNA